MNQDERNQSHDEAEKAQASVNEHPDDDIGAEGRDAGAGGSNAATEGPDAGGEDPAAGSEEPAAGDEDPATSGDADGTATGERDDNRDDNREGNGELTRMKEAMLRMQAEMDNREKRLEREMAKARKFALEALMRDLVQVLDSMDQALSSAGADDAKTAQEGLELTRKQALQVLTSHGLEVLDPAGEKFDPSWHEAMATQPSEEQEPDVILQVLQKGYRLHERLIRPARVIVAKDA